jgi:hypothetical protein
MFTVKVLVLGEQGRFIKGAGGETSGKETTCES